MTALVITPTQGEELLAACRASYEAREMPPYWLPALLPITAGPHQGMLAVDVGPEALAMVMIHDLTMAELPDFQIIMAMMGNPDPVELTAEETAQPVPPLI
jgi:hypothetical protein